MASAVKVICLAAVAMAGVTSAAATTTAPDGLERSRRLSPSFDCVVTMPASIWKGHPCSSTSAGTLVPGRLLTYANGQPKFYGGCGTIYCSVDGQRHANVKMTTESGKALDGLTLTHLIATLRLVAINK